MKIKMVRCCVGGGIADELGFPGGIADHEAKISMSQAGRAP